MTVSQLRAIRRFVEQRMIVLFQETSINWEIGTKC